MTLLDKPVQFLKGVGPRRAEALARMGILCARDLLYHVPRRYDDASTITPLALAQVGMDVTAVGEVRSKGVVPTRSGLRIFQAVIQDDTGIMTCAWPGQPWVERGMREGDRILVTGPVKFFHGRQIQPREHTLLARASDGPRRPGTPGTPGTPDSPRTPDTTPARRIRLARPTRPTRPAGSSPSIPPPKTFPNGSSGASSLSEPGAGCCKHVRAEEDHLTPPARRALGLPDLASTRFATLHRPPSLDAVSTTARRRLAYDELFFLQLLQAQGPLPRHAGERPGIAFQRTNELIQRAPRHVSPLP